MLHLDRLCSGKDKIVADSVCEHLMAFLLYVLHLGLKDRFLYFRVMSWWDYGYQIAGMANRTTLVDNNTWNNSHIALVWTCVNDFNSHDNYLCSRCSRKQKRTVAWAFCCILK